MKIIEIHQIARNNNGPILYNPQEYSRTYYKQCLFVKPSKHISIFILLSQFLQFAGSSSESSFSPQLGAMLHMRSLGTQ